jgi:hypothetical protein
MTRFLLVFLICGLFLLAVLGALAEIFRGRRPVLLPRREPALA